MQFAFERVVLGEETVEIYSDENQESLRFRFNMNTKDTFDIFHKNQTGPSIGKIVKHSVNLKQARILNCSNSEWYDMLLVLKEPEPLQKGIR
jgi:hypothetical protein